MLHVDDVSSTGEPLKRQQEQVVEEESFLPEDNDLGEELAT